MWSHHTKLFTGNSNPLLAQRVSDLLSLPLSGIEVGQFSDGEIRVEINESVRGTNSFIIQSTCFPTNDNLVELLSIADALRRSGTKSITAVIPYYGYARQDRRPNYSRVPITSKLIADVIQTAGVDSVILVDIHSKQQQGFFNIPSINISATPNFVADIWSNHMMSPDNVVIVSPDVGGVSRARTIAKQLQDRNLAIIDKRRPQANHSEVMNIIGDVEGKTTILIDDIVDTAGTLCKAANALKEQGAVNVIAYCTHPVLSSNALDNIENSSINQLVVTDTIPLQHNYSKVRVLSIASLIAETIYRLQTHQSVSEIYVN